MINKSVRDTALENKILRMFPMNAMFDTEAELLKKAKEFVELTPKASLVRVEAGMHSGISDVIINYYGRFIAAELKDRTGEATPQQLKFLQMQKNSGAQASVCRTLYDIWYLMQEAIKN